jgi:hypothetical protein
MGKRAVGAILCLTAGILFSARYLAAAIFLSGASSWDSGLFAAGLEYVGTPLRTLSIISLLVGVIYLVWAEVSDKKKSSTINH